MLMYSRFRFSQAVNFLHPHTIELRGIRPQSSVKALLHCLSLLEHRVASLRYQTTDPLTGCMSLLQYKTQNLADKV